MPLKAKGEFALVNQNMETARQKAGQPVKRGTMAHEHNMYMLLVDNAVQSQDANTLQQYLPLLEELAVRDEHRLYLAVAHRAWGVAHRLAGDYSEAKTRLNQAMELFGELGTQWQIGRTHIEMAEVDLLQSDQAGARNHYKQALSAFEALKAMPDVERVRLALNELE